MADNNFVDIFARNIIHTGLNSRYAEKTMVTYQLSVIGACRFNLVYW